VLNLDLAQTLLDFAGVPAPTDMQGLSWRPLLTSSVDTWRQSWFYEYFAERQINARVPDITAVRAVDAKLIKYTGHDEWTELFDLKRDSYETKNVYTTPEYATLRTRLEAEYDNFIRAVGYRVPDYVDRPDWWGKPGGPDWKPDPTPVLRLQYSSQSLSGSLLADASGQGNNGKAYHLALGEGRNGGKALLFSGESYVEVPNTISLDPSRCAWTVEVVAKPAKPAGVLVARGGRTFGYALWLNAGRAAFTVRTGNKAVTISAKAPVTDWSTITGTITTGRRARLRVNGEIVASASLPDFIARDPSDSMQIGADLGSPILNPAPPKYEGLMESVSIYRGEK